MDEEDAAAKIKTYNMHQATLDYTLENFEATYTKYKAMLGEEA